MPGGVGGEPTGSPSAPIPIGYGAAFLSRRPERGYFLAIATRLRIPRFYASTDTRPSDHDGTRLPLTATRLSSLGSTLRRIRSQLERR